mmetsp:Transcript_28145/g.49888  ORF Transcript_28145/g.49888 Transcript_28145/m.49888 type:complete len:91 (+) Transcript_28145:32-304(+)
MPEIDSDYFLVLVRNLSDWTENQHFYLLQGGGFSERPREMPNCKMANPLEKQSLLVLQARIMKKSCRCSHESATRSMGLLLLLLVNIYSK